MDTPRKRTPSGVPTGGQFASHDRPDADVAIGGSQANAPVRVGSSPGDAVTLIGGRDFACRLVGKETLIVTRRGDGGLVVRATVDLGSADIYAATPEADRDGLDEAGWKAARRQYLEASILYELPDGVRWDDERAVTAAVAEGEDDDFPDAETVAGAAAEHRLTAVLSALSVVDENGVSTLAKLIASSVVSAHHDELRVQGGERHIS